MSISRLSALCIVELSLSYVVRSLSNNPKDELRLFNFCVKFSTLASVLFNLVIIALTSNWLSLLSRVVAIPLNLSIVEGNDAVLALSWFIVLFRLSTVGPNEPMACFRLSSVSNTFTLCVIASRLLITLEICGIYSLIFFC